MNKYEENMKKYEGRKILGPPRDSSRSVMSFWDNVDTILHVIAVHCYINLKQITKLQITAWKF